MSQFRMRVSHTPPDRKVVAVVGVGGYGFFVPTAGEGSVYINEYGVATSTLAARKTLSALLLEDRDRKPVYEGDSITLQF
jgi:hypothetical protein